MQTIGDKCEAQTPMDKYEDQTLASVDNYPPPKRKHSCYLGQLQSVDDYSRPQREYEAKALVHRCEAQTLAGKC